MQRRLHLTIRGLVQGVAFRWSAERAARRLGLCGWVRNRPDGSVEVLAEGPEPVLQELLAWCREGPPGARVSGVAEKWLEATGELTRFEIRH
ncbi:MAG TPA: acylphosphatase [Polyangia bacterium]|nr:acylphosphatase [Polyangia bacterium]